MDEITRANAGRIMAAFIVSDGTSLVASATAESDRIIKRSVDIAKQIDGWLVERTTEPLSDGEHGLVAPPRVRRGVRA